MMSSSNWVLSFKTYWARSTKLPVIMSSWLTKQGWEIFQGNYSMMQNLVIYIDYNMVPGFEILVRIHSASVVNVMIQDSWEWLQFVPIYTQGSNITSTSEEINWGAMNFSHSITFVLLCVARTCKYKTPLPSNVPLIWAGVCARCVLAGRRSPLWCSAWPWPPEGAEGPHCCQHQGEQEVAGGILPV